MILKADPKLIAFIEKIVEEDKKRPEWKKGILEVCSRATNEKPR